MSERKSYHVMDATDRVPVDVAVGVLVKRDADGREGGLGPLDLSVQPGLLFLALARDGQVLQFALHRAGKQELLAG